MNRTGKTLLWMAVLAVGCSLHAVTPDRYNTIADRNIFRLTSPPPPPPPATNNEALDKNIELSGISNFGGEKKAWFIVKTKGAKDPVYLSIAENVRQDFLEVVKISEEEGRVDVLNSGNPMTLTFTNNAPKALPVAAAPAGVAATAVVPVSTPQASTYANPTPSYGGRSVTVTGGNTVSPNALGGQAANTSSTGLRTIPTRTLRLAPVAQQQETQVDPQKQLEMMQIQHDVYNAAGVPIPPLPPSGTTRNGTAPPPPPLPR